MSEYEWKFYKGKVDRLKREVDTLQWERQKATILRWVMLVTCVLNSLSIIITNLH